MAPVSGAAAMTIDGANISNDAAVSIRVVMRNRSRPLDFQSALSYDKRSVDTRKNSAELAARGVSSPFDDVNYIAGN
jgi:hypothetical protein